MKRIASVITVITALWSGTSCALDLSAYQQPDGAITVHPQDDHVDPYFAMKALWAARQLGDPALVETRAWIDWLLPRQSADGSFSRYCEQNATWRVCDEPDADDSMLAMWIELLHEAAPRGLPARWAESAQRAEHALTQLRDPKSGVYHISPKNNDALLMDNVEVYAAFRRIGELQIKAGDHAGGQRHITQARALRLAISKTFHPNGKDLLRWSSGDDSSEAFYPYGVAHLYPWLHQMNTEGFGPMLNWENWLNRYDEAWLTRSGDSYPWGLVALLAWREKSYPVVTRWLNNAVALRGSGNWDVLEEALLQGLARARLEHTQ
jgi:hypothetical protein